MTVRRLISEDGFCPPRLMTINKKNSRLIKRHSSTLLSKFGVGFVTMIACLTGGTLHAAPDGFSINSDSPSANADSLYRINLSNGSHNRIGTVTSFGQVRIDVEGLAMAPDGTLYGVDDSATTLFPINTGNGRAVSADEVSIDGVPTNGGNDFGMTFGCDGTLYISSVSTQTLYRVDLQGEATAIGAPGSLGENISAIAAYGTPVQLYGLGNGLDGQNGIDSRTLFEIDTETGTTVAIGTLGGQAADYHEAGLAFDDAGILWAITDRRAVPGGPFPSQILQINTANGQATAIASTQETGFESLSISVPRGCFVGAGEVANFTVNKRFMDGNNLDGATFTLSCNTGIPLEQSITVQPVNGDDEEFEVRFVVRDFESGALNCVLTEEAINGYTATYSCDGMSECTAGPPSPLDAYFQGPCSFSGVEEGDENLCFIRNYLDPVDVDVTKLWIDINEEFQGPTVAEMSWACVNARSSGSDLTLGTEEGDLLFHLPEQTVPFSVYPNFDAAQPTVCTVSEDFPGFDSDIESDDSECEGLLVSPGSGNSCTVINTRLYAGIPTLDAIGKALLMVLMLSVGLIAARRHI
jgi:hypothetical protein